MYFLHPEILWWLALVLIPVIIHFFNFRKYKKLYFSNIEFLKNITRQTRKQNKLKHLVVLLLRMLAVALVVIAFASPRFGDKETVIPSKIKSIYVDNSYSMMGESSKGPAFEVARNIAFQLVKTSEKDERFLIQTNDYTSGKKLITREQALEEIGKIKITPAVRMFSEINTRQKKQIKAGEGFESFWLSDFQRYAVDVQHFDRDTSNDYVFITIDHVRKKNIYVDTCYFEKPVLLPGQKAKLKVVVANASGEAYSKVPLKLFINNQLKSVEGIDLGAFKKHETTFTFAPDKAGWQLGKIVVEDYPVTFDDELFFTFNVKGKIKVLDIFYNKPNKFIRAFYTADSNFSYAEQNFLHLDLTGIQQYNMVVVDGLKDITSGLSSILKNYLSSGGNILVVPSQEQNVTSINGFLKNVNAGSFSQYDTVKTRVAGIKKSAPFFKETLNKVPNNASLPTVQNYFPLHYHVSSGITDLMTLLNGDALLVAKRSGQGNLFVLTTPLTEKTTDFMYNPLFVAVMYGIPLSSDLKNRLFYFIGGNDKIPLPYNLEGEDGVFKLNLKGSNYSFIPGQQAFGNATVLSLYNTIDKAGFYEGVYADSVYFVLAFNYNHKESSMDFLSADDLDSLMRNSAVNNYIIEKGEINNIAKVINDKEKGSQLWKLFIILALFMLLAEGLILRFWK